MNINYFAPINNTGYGVASANIYNELSQICDVALFPIGDITNGDINPDRIKLGLHQSMFFDVKAPCVKIWHQNSMSKFIGSGLHVGFPFFELDEFNPMEKHHLNSLDGVVVSSSWAKNIVLQQTKHKIENVGVVPLGVKPHMFRKSLSPKNLQTTTKFFTCGKWEKRKGHDVLIQAFNKAFEINDMVELHVMCDNLFIGNKNTDNWQRLYGDSKLGSKVRFLPRVASHDEVLAIMSNMDCGVYISRAEGWNLELLETMSCGVPVIATKYSAHTEFCNEKNSYLVDIEDVEIAHDDFWFKSGIGHWAKIEEKQIDQIVEYMRMIHDKKPYNAEGINTAKKFTWKNSAEKLIKLFHNQEE